MTDNEPNPYQECRMDYRLRLEYMMTNDYKQLDLLYSLFDKVNDNYENGKIDLLQTIDSNLMISREINTIHDRIRKRLHL